MGTFNSFSLLDRHFLVCPTPSLTARDEGISTMSPFHSIVSTSDDLPHDSLTPPPPPIHPLPSVSVSLSLSLSISLCLCLSVCLSYVSLIVRVQIIFSMYPDRCPSISSKSHRVFPAPRSAIAKSGDLPSVSSGLPPRSLDITGPAHGYSWNGCQWHSVDMSNPSPSAAFDPKRDGRCVDLS